MSTVHKEYFDGGPMPPLNSKTWKIQKYRKKMREEFAVAINMMMSIESGINNIE